MATGIARAAAAFYPQNVTVHLSEHVSEYADLLGGGQFSAYKDVQWTGARRYVSRTYRAAFVLECRAVQMAREVWGLTNISVNIPFCQTPAEAAEVLKILREHGVSSAEKMQVYVDCDVPTNLILVEEYSKMFDGLRIGAYAPETQSLAKEINPVVREMINKEGGVACP